MAKTVDYFLSVYSPWTYFGDARLHEIADRHGANINYKPMQLSRVFPATGGLPLAKRAPQRQDYRLAELARWQKRLGLTINTHPKHFPTDERTASAMAVAATLKGVDPGDFINSLLAAVWVWELDIGDEGTLVRIANEAGLGGAALLAAAKTPEVLAALDANGLEAISRGVFGAPFYFVDDEPFWGQDRLDFVDEALGG